MIDQKKYPKPSWAVSQLVREFGLIEDVCEHGVGHPNLDWLKEKDPNHETTWSIHGCEGCCSQIDTNKEKING